MAARARRTAARYAEQLEATTLGRLWSRLLEVEFVDRSIALAAKAFVSFLPLLVIVAALSPDSVRDNIVTIFSTRFGISGPAFDTVAHAFTSPEQTKTAAGIVGTLITVAFAVSFTTALQRVYLRAWRRPPGGGPRNQARGAAWLGAVLVLLLMVVAAGVVLNGPIGSVLNWALGLLACTALWWWTARLMVRGEVRWRALLPTAIVMGIGGWLYTLAAALWMPADVTSQYAQFGAFGIAQAFLVHRHGVPADPGRRPRASPSRRRQPARPLDAIREPHRRRSPRRTSHTRADPTGPAIRRLRPRQPRVRCPHQRPHRRHTSNLNSSAASVLHNRSFAIQLRSIASSHLRFVTRPV